MSEDRLPISSSRVTAVDVSRHSFTTVRRGFEPHEVRSYLELVARELSAWEQRYEELRAELAQAEERARNPVIDEATLAQALGQQSAQILRHAHSEAARIIQAAEETAAATVRQAQQQATEAAVRAESTAAERIAEAEIAAGSVHQRAAEEAGALTEEARQEAERLHEAARQQGRSMIEQANDARRRVLGDLAQRRRAVMLQIEQFRAARDQVASSVVTVRREIDRILSDLSRADDEARAAAAEVARRGVVEPEGDLLDEAETAVAGLGAAIPATSGEAPTAAVEAVGRPVDRVPDIPGDLALTEGEAATAGPSEDGEPATPGDRGSVRAPDRSEHEHAPAEPGSGPVAGASGSTWNVGQEDAQDSVEGLFARLRAGQEHVGAPAEAEGADEAPVAPPPGTAAAPADIAPGLEEVAPSAADAPEVAEEPGPDDQARGRRAELLDPVTAKLARRLKRILQDDQNQVLDRLRGDGSLSVTVLGSEDEHRHVMADAANPFLEDAMKAGFAFGRTGGRTPRVTGADREAVSELADNLAGTVVTLLRRRLGEEEATGDDAMERVGAAYREWRGERIERLVGDYAVGAFSLGVIRAAGRGAHVRWVLAGTGHDCADCEDNALAESLEAGAEFPTGHHHPPAHAGCRCLVVPTSG